ncbi:hypothetical protein [Streptomyces sp. cmx-4-9]|uniref:hypothetical protein n=1 Tax=Streptomyces sp. cmx-4-9 TaxID=2790941 RepID=UPI00397F2FC6
MSVVHARPRSPFPRSARPAEAAAPRVRRGRRAGIGTRLRRRIRAHRDIDILPSHIPGDGAAAGGRRCLLLVRFRKVVGQIHYRACTSCGEGVITAVDIDTSYESIGARLHTSALSHLRFRHPDLTWHPTNTRRGLRYRPLSRTERPGSRCMHPAG